MPSVLTLGKGDLNLIGGKAYALSKIINKFNVPKGFVITTEVHDYYKKYNKFLENSKEEISKIIENLNINIL